MDFKLFMNSVEENLSLIKTEEELRNWIRNYARSIPEEERESFLEQMQTRKSRSHKEILKELTEWCEKIEEGEITLSCSGYEEYGEYGESLQNGVKRSKREKLLFPAAAMKSMESMEKAGGTATG